MKYIYITIDSKKKMEILVEKGISQKLKRKYDTKSRKTSKIFELTTQQKQQLGMIIIMTAICIIFQNE